MYRNIIIWKLGVDDMTKIISRYLKVTIYITIASICKLTSLFLSFFFFFSFFFKPQVGYTIYTEMCVCVYIILLIPLRFLILNLFQCIYSGRKNIASFNIERRSTQMISVISESPFARCPSHRSYHVNKTGIDSTELPNGMESQIKT